MKDKLKNASHFWFWFYVIVAGFHIWLGEWVAAVWIAGCAYWMREAFVQTSRRSDAQLDAIMHRNTALKLRRKLDFLEMKGSSRRLS